MNAQKFYNEVTEYLKTREGMRVGKYMVHPHSYEYGFSGVEVYNGKIVMWEGDFFENEDDSTEPSLPLKDILNQLKKVIDEFGDMELIYETKWGFESPTQFIVSYGNITPINLNF